MTMLLDDKVELIRLTRWGKLHVFIKSAAVCGARQGHVSRVAEVTTAGAILATSHTPGVCVGCRRVVKRELKG